MNFICSVTFKNQTTQPSSVRLNIQQSATDCVVTYDKNSYTGSTLIIFSRHRETMSAISVFRFKIWQTFISVNSFISKVFFS